MFGWGNNEYLQLPGTGDLQQVYTKNLKLIFYVKSTVQSNILYDNLKILFIFYTIYACISC